MILRGASSGSKVKKTTITKDEKDPAVVFFPTNQDSECMDGATGELIVLILVYKLTKQTFALLLSLSMSIAFGQLLGNSRGGNFLSLHILA